MGLSENHTVPEKHIIVRFSIVLKATLAKPTSATVGRERGGEGRGTKLQVTRKIVANSFVDYPVLV